MNKRKQKYNIVLLAFMMTISITAIGQVPHFSTVPNLEPGDSLSITQLINSGIKVGKGKIIGWFPKDSLSAGQINKILDTLQIGVAAAEKLIKAPLPWQVQQQREPYTFYFRPDSIVSHASGAGFVSISFWRIKQGKAPWLHEAIHEMLNTKAGYWDSASEEVWKKKMPLWLAEGLPDYISLKVSQQHSLAHFDVFTNSSFTNVDSVCREDLKGSKADSILSYIGAKGAMTALFGKERRLYAPTFYHCSCSFVKYLAERIGLPPLIESLAAYPNEIETLEKKTPTSLKELKKLWLTKINSR